MDGVSYDSPNVVVYRFFRVVFGLNASPFLLNGTIRHHLGTFAEIDPGFVKKMVEGFYFDNLVSEDSTTEGWFTGVFKLGKCKTNDPVLRFQDIGNKSGGMEKVYVALFSCCVMRVLHLELVEYLLAESFRHCLRRFITRNETPEFNCL